MTALVRHGASLQIALESLRDLRSLKSRALLALVGVAIGTAAVIATLHAGYNAKVEALRQFEAMGVDLVSATTSMTGHARPLSLDAVLALPHAHIGISDVAAVVQSGVQLRTGHDRISTDLLAATGQVYELAKVGLEIGRFTSDLDGSAPFAVVGAKIADSLRASRGRKLAPGDTLLASGQVYTVVGILRSTEPNLILGLDMDNTIVIPFSAARRAAPNPIITNIAARLSPGVDDVKAAVAMQQYLEAEMGGGSVSLQTARQIIRGVEGQMRIYAVLLLGIGTVSLVVGGVGVMNVMLMRVMERRQEIGLRQALGARRRDIRLMFLTEALALSIVGSLVGIVLGYVAGWIFAFSAGWQFDPAPAAVPLGLGMALVVGLFFGSYPAYRASRLEPIQALRAQ